MIKLGNRHFTPPWWATLLFLLVGSIMLLLGRWQLQRAEEKINLAAAAAQALAAEALNVHELLDASPAGDTIAVLNYGRLYARGRLLVERQFLWDNRIHKGQAGFEIIVPMLLEAGPGVQQDRVLMLNRGWVPAGRSRSDLPDVVIAGPVFSDTGSQSLQIEGLLTHPSRGFASGPALPEDGQAGHTETAWPKLLQYLDYSAMAEALGYPVIDGLVQHLSEVMPATEGILKTDNWQPVANGPEKHYGYAFQWFGMFIALAVIYWVTNTRKSAKKIAGNSRNSQDETSSQRESQSGESG